MTVIFYVQRIYLMTVLMSYTLVLLFYFDEDCFNFLVNMFGLVI